jgi:sphingomyelin phosphodiesterase
MMPVAIDSIFSSWLSPDYFCEEVAPACPYSSFVDSPAAWFMENILDQISENANDYLNSLYDQIRTKDNRPTIRAVHFTNPHVDPQYTVGTDSECNNYLCCRPENGVPSNSSRQAKHWGSYNCDLPQHTFDSFIHYVKTVVQPDIVFWTGDNSPHDIWNNTETQVI